jgi:predicted Zn-dependent protease
METAQKTNIGVTVLCTLTSICESGLGQAAVKVGGTALFARYTRADELQADSEAVVNVARAGFDPKGIPELFEALLQQREYAPTKVEGWFASHPLEEARIERAKRLITELDLEGEGNLIIDTPNFQVFRARVNALPPPPRRSQPPP